MGAGVEEAQDRRRVVGRDADDRGRAAWLDGPAQVLDLARLQRPVLGVEDEEVPAEHPDVLDELRFGRPDEAAEGRLAGGQLRLGRGSPASLAPSVEPEAGDVLPALRRPRADHRGGHRRVGQRVAEVRAVRPAGLDRPEELERLDELHVLVAERVAAARDDVALVRERVAGEHLDEPVGRLLLGQVEAAAG